MRRGEGGSTAPGCGRTEVERDGDGLATGQN